jgi:hypothetical protein
MRVRTIVLVLCLIAALGAVTQEARGDSVPAATLLVPYFKVDFEGTSELDPLAENPPGCLADLLRGDSSLATCAYKITTRGRGRGLGRGRMVETCEVDATTAEPSPRGGFTLYRVGCALELRAADRSTIRGRSVGELLVLAEGRAQQTTHFVQLGGSGRFTDETPGGGFGQRAFDPGTSDEMPTTQGSGYTFYGRYFP